jgi:hypothetical protein
MTEDARDDAVAGYLAGDPVEAPLLDAVRRDPAAIDALADHVEVETLLVAWGTEARGGRFADEVRARIEAEPSGGAFAAAVRGRILRRRRVLRWSIAAGAAAAVLAAAIGFGGWPSDPPAAARLTGSVAAEWSTKPRADLRTGDGVDLDAGLAELTLAGGVVLILEGPARIRLAGGARVRLERGCLTARVPKGAEGFRVDTPSSEVVDLGTEFGVRVGADGSSEVHVLRGRVQARRDGQDAFVQLAEGHGLRFAALARQVEAIGSDPVRFVRALPGRSTERPAFLHWAFDEGEGRIADDTGPGIGGARYPARLEAFEGGEGPSWGAGRFGRALFFNGVDAFATTGFPGIGGADPRTLAFWARVPADFEAHQGYGMLGWGAMRPGNAWQLSPNPWAREGPVGRLRIGTYDSFAIGTTDLRDDRWHHVAVVMYGGRDADVGTHILLYVDGRLEPTTARSIRAIDTDTRGPGARALAFGRNLGFRGGPSFRDRFFRGWLDEVYIFDAALSSDQVRALREANRLP